MALTDDVKRLAALARIEVKDDEIEKFAKEFESVLAYVGQIESLKVSDKAGDALAVRNVMREDGEPHGKGLYTKAIVEQFPDKEGNSLKVAKILSND